MFPGDEHARRTGRVDCPREGPTLVTMTREEWQGASDNLRRALRRLGPLLYTGAQDSFAVAKEAIAQAESSSQRALDAANFAINASSEAHLAATLAVDQCQVARRHVERLFCRPPKKSARRRPRRRKRPRPRNLLPRGRRSARTRTPEPKRKNLTPRGGRMHSLLAFDSCRRCKLWKRVID